MELSVATLLFLSLTFLVSLMSRKWAPSPKARRPPGPRRLPLVGSLHHLLTPQRHVALRDLAEKHGPVMYLRLGQLDAVVVSSPALAQEVLRDKSLCFASRPQTTATEIVSYGNLDLAFAPYGAYWRTLRRLCTVELLSERKVRRFAPLRDRETMAAVRTVRCGEPVLPLLLPCACQETCDVGGFQVAKGSMLIINAWAVARSQCNDGDAEGPTRLRLAAAQRAVRSTPANDVRKQFFLLPLGKTAICYQDGDLCTWDYIAGEPRPTAGGQGRHWRRFQVYDLEVPSI